MESNYKIMDPTLNGVLSEWDGSQAEVWKYGRSHAALLICLLVRGKQTMLQVLCNRPRSFCGQFTWPNCKMRVELTQRSDYPLPTLIVTDTNGEMQMECASITATEAQAPSALSHF